MNKEGYMPLSQREHLIPSAQVRILLPRTMDTRSKKLSLIHHELQSKESIRLLILHPGQVNDPINISLLETTLRSAPAYEAVSYVWAQEPGHGSVLVRTPESDPRLATRATWSSQPPGHKVKSSTVSISITQNLLNLLRMVRRRRFRQVLWIDQLCINQADLAERAQQVQLMHHIYRKASRTLVWLGMPAAGSSQVMEFIPTLTRRLQRVEETDLDTRSLEVHGLPGITDYMWLNLCHFFQRPWFARMWTVQEVAVARSTILRCGASMLSWKDLSTCVSALWKHHALLTAILSRLPFKRGTGGNWAPSQVSAIGNIRTGAYTSVQTGTLVEILSAFANCEATDPRDNIFSIQGLIPEAEKSLLPKPDYDRSIEDVFMDVAKTYVQHYSSADILPYAGISRQSLQLPSWVPDWSSKILVSSFSRASKYSVLKRANLVPSEAGSQVVPLYNASGARESRFELAMGGHGLRVSVKLLTRVEQLGPSFPTSNGRPGFAFSGSDAWRAYANTRPQYEACFRKAQFCSPSMYRSSEEAESACQMCLIGGRTRDLRRANVISTRRRFNALSQLYDQVQNQSGQMQGETDPGTQHEAENLILDLHIVTSGRTFFVSRSEHFGLAPIKTSKGDHVSLIGGMSVPFIIRRKGHNFELIGECYLEGFMFGEGSNNMKYGDWDQIILI